MAYFGTFIVKNDALVNLYFIIQKLAVNLFRRNLAGLTIDLNH
jgi:hypothetical protein